MKLFTNKHWQASVLNQRKFSIKLVRVGILILNYLADDQSNGPYIVSKAMNYSAWWATISLQFSCKRLILLM